MKTTAWEPVHRALDHWPGTLAAESRRPYEQLLRACEEEDAPAFWEHFPRHVHEAFAGRGWAWNGIYARDADRLRLRCAFGPPVCAELELHGEVGSSGMCWDALLRDETLWADPVSGWPGYVSCDGESGLKTRAGLVVPLRQCGRAVAVWDLDALEPLRPEDPALMTAVLTTALARHAL